jgi:CubicO group peptidase (beta-lactamase class C family)
MCRRTVVFAGCAFLLAGCSSSDTSTGSRSIGRPRSSSSVPTSTTAPVTTTTAVRKIFDPNAFDATDALLEERVRSAGVAGGMIRIVAVDGAVIHERTVGKFSGNTPLSVASSTKWLTTATFMTFVDQGAIGLDDDISKWLPEFGGSNPPITARQLLDHTSGVHDNPCQSDGTALATCVRALASSAREFPAGSKFSYGNSPFLAVGRLVELLGDADFAAVVRTRLTSPLGMDDTTWPGAPTAASPAFGATITVDDYGKFLDMILHDGMSNGTRVLSSDAVREMLMNQVSGYDTSHDYSVGITKIPRYGLGCWLDIQEGSATASVVSGNGGKGFYPWVDFATQTWGIVGIQDQRGAQVAVPASQTVEIEARSAVAR